MCEGGGCSNNARSTSEVSVPRPVISEPKGMREEQGNSLLSIVSSEQHKLNTERIVLVVMATRDESNSN